MTTEQNHARWEKIYSHENQDIFVVRMKVPSGWLYKTYDIERGMFHINVTFVPEPDKCNLHNEYTVKTCCSCIKEK